MSKGVLLEEEHRITITPDLAQRRRYLYLPVDVPAFAAELYAGYEVVGRARIDMGVFEPSEREIPEMKAFRGWSGSARTEFCISRHDATPGYLPGAVVPGRWRIVLGLYVVEEECEVVVRIRVSRRLVRCSDGNRDFTGELEQARRGALDVPGLSELGSTNPLRNEGWVRGDLHCHTEHSNDSEHPMSVATAVAVAETLGLDYVAITDHNTSSQWREIEAFAGLTSVELIRAEEVTTYRGHFNVFGPAETVEFRTDSDSEVETIIAEAAHQGALVSINHPKKVGPPWEYSIPGATVAIEAWQAPWLWMNWESMGLWSRLLDEGRRLTAIGGSDVHDLFVRPDHTMGVPTTWILPDGEGVDGLLAGIRRGSCMISEAPSSPVLVLEIHEEPGLWRPGPGSLAEPGQAMRIRLVGEIRGLSLCIRRSDAEKEWLVLGSGDERLEIEPLASHQRWMRAELWALGELGEADTNRRLVAVTNPVYSNGAC